MKEPIKQYKPAEKLELPKIEKEFPKVFKKVSCPSCSQDVGADHINLQNSMAKCGNCNVIFSIEEEVASLKTKEEMKQEIFRPEGIDLFYYKDDLEISVQQHIQGVDAFGIIFLPIFAAFAIFVYFEKDISIYIPLLTSLAAAYFIVKGFKYKNYKTYIDISARSLTVKYRPNNLKKDKTFAAEDVDQIYLKQSADGSGNVSLFAIINSTKGQQHQKLLQVNTLSKAKYLEQEIENYLGIENRKVPESNIEG